MSLPKVSSRVVPNCIKLARFGMNQTVSNTSCHLYRVVVEIRYGTKLIDILALLPSDLIVPVISTAVNLPLSCYHQHASLGAINVDGFAFDVSLERWSLRRELVFLAQASRTVFSRSPCEQRAIFC